MGKPRIAFCFSGQARTLDQTYPFIKSNIIDAAKEQGFDYDVFCAVEDDEDCYKVNLLNPTNVEKIKSTEVEQIIIDRFWKDQERLSNYTFMKRLPQNPNMLLWYLQQVYKFTKSIKMANNQNKEYDLVVRLRFDFYFFNKLNYKNIIEATRGKSIICNDTLFIRKFTIITDFFFVWNQKTMTILSEIFDNFLIGFKWWEHNRIIYNIFNSIRRLIFYFNKTVIKKWIIPVTPIWFMESRFNTIFTPEYHCYKYLCNNGVRIIKEYFSLVLLRKNIENSRVSLNKKTKYEI